ncbi:unnamed protein product [Amoebophrya sp. A25]|nr:unnamed protein product [Amoebophrya sp. A25]|eukprot:GSA25T00012456001.1
MGNQFFRALSAPCSAVCGASEAPTVDENAAALQQETRDATTTSESTSIKKPAPTAISSHLKNRNFLQPQKRTYVSPLKEEKPKSPAKSPRNSPGGKASSPGNVTLTSPRPGGSAQRRMSSAKRSKIDNDAVVDEETLRENRKKYLLTVDQGTTSSRCLLFDSTFRHVKTSQEEFPQYYPKPGWVEHDPEEIVQSVQNCMQKLGVAKDQVSAIGIANQRETTIAWDRETGKPLAKAVVWMDTRTIDVVKDLVKRMRNDKDFFRPVTGLPISTYFSGLKIKWLLQNVKAVKEAHDAGKCCFGTVDSWLVYRMTGGKQHVTDVSNASRYMLMDLRSRQWSADILRTLGIKKESLPKIVSNVDNFGVVSEDFSRALAGVPICGMLGDQHAALVGQCCFDVGEAKNTYGTGCFMIANTGPKIVPSTKGLLTTIGYQMGKGEKTVYALEGSVAIAGRLIQWLRDNLKIISDAPQVEGEARKCTSSGGVSVVPAFQGLFAPHWRDDAKAVLCGMTLQTGISEICRASLEAVALQVCDILIAMEGDGIPVKQLRVDGGMTVNELLMQVQADLLGVSVQRPTMVETTALGATMAAAIGVGLYKSTSEIHEVVMSSGQTEYKTFEPQMAFSERKKMKLQWAKAVAKTVNDHSNL